MMADIAGIGSFTDIGGTGSSNQDQEPREITPEEEERRAGAAAPRSNDTTPSTDPLVEGGEDQITLSSAALSATASDDANEEDEEVSNRLPEAGNEERDSAVSQSIGRVVDRFA